MTNSRRALGNGLENRLVQRARKRRLHAHKQPGSGQFKDYPNDAVVEAYLHECKVRSTLPSMAQVLEWLAYVESNAKKYGFKGGILVFNQKGSRRPKVVLDLDLWLDVLEFANRG